MERVLFFGKASIKGSTFIAPGRTRLRTGHETGGTCMFSLRPVSHRHYCLVPPILLFLLVIIAGDTNSAAAGMSISDSAISSTQSVVESHTPSSDFDVLIGSGDLLEIRVLGQPEYLEQVRVSGDGQITLPFIGALRVA